MSGHYDESGPSHAQGQSSSTRAPRKRKKNPKTSGAKAAQEAAVLLGVQKEQSSIDEGTNVVVPTPAPVEEAPVPAPTPAAVKPAPKSAAPKPPASDSDSDDSDSGNEGGGGAEGEGAGGKKRKARKRKRTRAKKVKELPDTDPSADAALGEVAKASLIYAYQYHHSRSEWKFAKARQAWLMRHALSLPVEAPAKEAGAPGLPSQAEQFEADQEALPCFFPDAYVGVVGRYLGTVQGAAKERFIATLKAALEAPAAPAPAAAPAAGAEAPADNGASTTFGALAMATDAAQSAAAAEGTDAPADPALIEARRERARSLLSAMGELP